LVFRVVMLKVFSPEDGGIMFLRNGGIRIQVRTASQPRRLTLTSSLYFREISYTRLRSSPVIFAYTFNDMKKK
jgi:hypothetical protein